MAAERGGPRAALWMSALCASGLLGWAATLGGAEAPLAGWIWLSLWALPGGALAGARLAPGWQLLPPVTWMLGAWLCSSALAEPLASLLALGALYLFGLALHGGSGARAWGLAGTCLFAVGVLAALPSGGGALAQPFSPESTARWLDLSPLVWVLESGGIDWMRHPSVYELAGAADIGPNLRVARSGYGGPLVALALGAVAALLRARLGGASASVA